METKVEKVTEEYQILWVKQWTLHRVEIPEDRIEEIAEKISKCLDREHSWYADFKNPETHYIIFRNKIFKVNRDNKEEYDKVTK